MIEIETPLHGEEELEPVIKLFGQWAVTTYGVECVDGTYFISKSRLWEDEGTHGWKRHMAEKEWVHTWEFNDALDYARTIWNKRGKVIRPREFATAQPVIRKES